jgi:hypothetical protein
VIGVTVAAVVVVVFVAVFVAVLDSVLAVVTGVLVLSVIQVCVPSHQAKPHATPARTITKSHRPN